MSTGRTPNRLLVGFWLLVSLVGGLWVLAEAAAAEEAKSADRKSDVARPASREAQEVRIYHLKHAEPSSAAIALSELLPKTDSPQFNITVDERTNAIILMGAPEVQARVAELIELLDRPAEDHQTREMKVFRLEHADVSSVAMILAGLFSMDDVRIAPDARTNSVFAIGTPREMVTLEALLKHLDEKERDKPDAAATYLLRVVWFTDAPPAGKAVEIDNQMKFVEAEMAKIGVGPIHAVAQTMVSATPGSEFQMGCSLTWPDGLVLLEVDGKLEIVHGTPQLTIKLTADQELSTEQKAGTLVRMVDLVDLATEIVAPLGHFVVLGVTPAGKMTSVFAVQVTPCK